MATTSAAENRPPMFHFTIRQNFLYWVAPSVIFPQIPPFSQPFSSPLTSIYFLTRVITKREKENTPHTQNTDQNRGSWRKRKHITVPQNLNVNTDTNDLTLTSSHQLNHTPYPFHLLLRHLLRFLLLFKFIFLLPYSLHKWRS